MRSPRRDAILVSSAPIDVRRRVLLAALPCLGAVAAWRALPASAAELVTVIPSPSDDVVATSGAKEAVAVIAGGCFWGVQAVYQHVKGVRNAVSGYAGGDAKTANYDAIGSGRTGHAEAVKISYDPSQVSYGTLLQIFFSVVHNPTELNRQGPDTGTQYRSTIFPVDAEQRRVAERYIAQLDQTKLFRQKIATTIEPDKVFYPADDYHQDFLVRHPNHPYIVINDQPKIEQLKKVFPAQYQDKPVLVRSA
ncbi:peptide-methionine (S)-S-oxide reductase MsrA [Pigmentiphaga aceris]|uniref:Peptide methionine sulfoxide reductase MsrA n=1 Tax=Pigmentiphaga aceris TaxID=1940612 RepID=A0A5C0B1U5_9BURK|nr:peptide-methionine (S)-S-oxide reductase MsrA [Pigmentiphaga aceris]QEI07854.1 peptide-methionine (S)-S-oxide reductase MsrA [Pigmentiphaga aceris]